MSFKPKLFTSESAAVNSTGDDPLRSDEALGEQVPCSDMSVMDVDDAAFEGELPDDLAELSDQLVCDAAHLAALYPCQPRQSAAPKHRSWLGVSAAAVLLAACAGAVLGSWSRMHKNSPVLAETRQSPAVVQTASKLPAASAGKSSAGVTSNRPTVQASLFQDLSGPEQEAVLDLLETDELGQSNLSI